MPIRVVVAGISHWHAPRYLSACRERGLELVAVSDHVPDTAELRGRALGCRAYPSTPDMLARERPDFAIVLPRHDKALNEIRAIADRRVAALIEKPMGLNADEAVAAADAVQRAGIFAASCLPNRHLKFWQAVNTLRSEDRLGQPIHATFRLINGSPRRYRDEGAEWMLEPATAGGGVLRNLGAHGTDAMRVLAGETLHVKDATTTHIAYNLPVEDYATATLNTPGGFVATIEVGYTNAGKNASDQELRLAATGAYVVDAKGTLSVSTPSGQHSEPSYQAADVYRLMVNEALDRFESGRAPLVDIGECAQAVRIIDEIYACAADGEH